MSVERAYYSVPVEYLTRSVWVRWDARLMRIFNHRFEQIAIHAKQPPGKFSTQTPHIATEKINGNERGATWLLQKAGHIGPHAEQWAAALLEHRGIEGLRVLQGLSALAAQYGALAIDAACEVAQSYETSNTMMTSNRPLEDWVKLIGDVPSATAILDRFLYHAEVIAITGRSYRLRNQATTASETPTAPKPANAPISAASSDTGIVSEPNTSSPRRRKAAAQSV